jgi:hypothetical protein
MRAAPAVEAALGQGRAERMLITGLHVLAGAGLSRWVVAHVETVVGRLPAGLSWIVGLVGALALGAVGFWLARRVLPAEPSRLCWDGASWQLSSGWRGESRQEGMVPLRRVVVSLDLGAWMLLQLAPADGAPPRWRVASARGVGTAWHGLRVALQAHAGDLRIAEVASADRAVESPGSRP